MMRAWLTPVVVLLRPFTDRQAHNVRLPETVHKWTKSAFQAYCTNGVFNPHLYLDDIREYGSGGVNFEILEEIIKQNGLSKEQFSLLSDYFTRGYNDAFRRCFPGDAFDILRAQNMIAEYIMPNEPLDLDREWNRILDLLEIRNKNQELTTEVIFRHFRNFHWKNRKVQNSRKVTEVISSYITECIRRAHRDDDPTLLERVIPAFKILGYIHKLDEFAHFSCSDEFNKMVSFGLDREKLQFKYLSKEELGRTKERFAGVAFSGRRF